MEFPPQSGKILLPRAPASSFKHPIHHHYYKHIHPSTTLHRPTSTLIPILIISTPLRNKSGTEIKLMVYMRCWLSSGLFQPAYSLYLYLYQYQILTPVICMLGFRSLVIYILIYCLVLGILLWISWYIYVPQVVVIAKHPVYTMSTRHRKAVPVWLRILKQDRVQC